MTLVEQTRTFFRETAVEVRKVAWPTRKELTESTMLVIVTVTILMFLVFFIDRGFSAIVELILG
ncbi:MAG TPA: preprotein translocase subunit SecE [Candidatus Eisenbacteria bacterium]